jgi:hypothetical protein
MIEVIVVAILTLLLHVWIWAYGRIDRRYNVQMVRIWRRYKRQAEEDQRHYKEERREIDRQFQENVERFRAEMRGPFGMSAPKAPTRPS